MPNPGYFRRQAEICLRLAASMRLENAARHLVELAERFMDRAKETEQRNRQTQNLPAHDRPCDYRQPNAGSPEPPGFGESAAPEISCHQARDRHAGCQN